MQEIFRPFDLFCGQKNGFAPPNPAAFGTRSLDQTVVQDDIDVIIVVGIASHHHAQFEQPFIFNQCREQVKRCPVTVHTDMFYGTVKPILLFERFTNRQVKFVVQTLAGNLR